MCVVAAVLAPPPPPAPRPRQPAPTLQKRSKLGDVRAGVAAGEKAVADLEVAVAAAGVGREESVGGCSVKGADSRSRVCGVA